MCVVQIVGFLHAQQNDSFAFIAKLYIGVDVGPGFNRVQRRRANGFLLQLSNGYLRAQDPGKQCRVGPN